jgi:hypothetical protein
MYCLPIHHTQDLFLQENQFIIDDLYGALRNKLPATLCIFHEGAACAADFDHVLTQRQYKLILTILATFDMSVSREE